MSWVFENSTAKYAARLVLLAIANHADKDGRNAWASVRQLAEEAHVSERQARYALRELEASKEIVQAGVSPHRTYVYELPAMQTLFPISQEGADIAGAESAGGNLRQLRGQSAAAKGAELAPEPKGNRPKATVEASDEDPEARRLCELLADLIVANGSKRPTIGKAWLTEARRLLRLDKRPPDEIERVLRWSQADDFWRGNVLSMPTFRSKYDRLRLASTRTTTRRASTIESFLAEEGVRDG